MEHTLTVQEGRHQESDSKGERTGENTHIDSPSSASVLSPDTWEL